MAHKRHHSLIGLSTAKDRNGELVQTRRCSINGGGKSSSKNGSKGSQSNGHTSRKEEFDQIRVSRQNSFKIYEKNGESKETKQRSKLEFYPLSDNANVNGHEDIDKSEIEGLYKNSGLSDYQSLSEFHESSLKMLENGSNLRHGAKSSKKGQVAYKGSKTEVKIDKNRVRSIVDTERKNGQENDVETESFSESERYEPYVRLHGNLDVKVDSGSYGNKSGTFSGEFVTARNVSCTKQSKSYSLTSVDNEDTIDRKEFNALPEKPGMEYRVYPTGHGQRSGSFEGHQKVNESSRSGYSGSQKINNLYNERTYSREKSIKSDLKQDLKRHDANNINYGKLDIMFKHVQNDQFKMVMVSDDLNDKEKLNSSNRDNSSETVRHSKSEQVLGDTERRIYFLESKEQASFILRLVDLDVFYNIH